MIRLISALCLLVVAAGPVLADAIDDARAALVVVQPGNSLWRIARRRYGLGPQYVQIFEANLDQISDPDLIYPGQIFELPQVN